MERGHDCATYDSSELGPEHPWEGVQTLTATLVRLLKKGNFGICYSMEKRWQHDAKQKIPQSQKNKYLEVGHLVT